MSKKYVKQWGGTSMLLVLALLLLNEFWVGVMRAGEAMAVSESDALAVVDTMTKDTVMSELTPTPTWTSTHTPTHVPSTPTHTPTLPDDLLYLPILLKERIVGATVTPTATPSPDTPTPTDTPIPPTPTNTPVTPSPTPKITPEPTDEPTPEPTDEPTPKPPTITPTSPPIEGDWAGTTGRNQPMSFDVVGGGEWVENFRVRIRVTGDPFCSGTFDIIVRAPLSISDNEFSANAGIFTMSGKFTSPATASGEYRLFAYPPPPPCILPITHISSWTATP